MESQRVLICLALFAACVLAVNSAAIENAPVVPAEPQGQAPTGESQPITESKRDKKWALPLYPYAAIPYSGYAYPTAYSAYPYYPAYRSLPYYAAPYII